MFVSTVVSVALSVVLILLFTFLNNLHAPRYLGNVPDGTTDFVAIGSNGFLDAAPVLENEDGNLYEMVDTLPVAWRPAQDNWINIGDPCVTRRVNRVARKAGDITFCLEGMPPWEWCPAPTMTYAITDDGELWLLETHSVCGLAVIGFGLAIGLAGFAVSLVFVVGRSIYFAIRKRNQTRGTNQ